MNPITMTTTNNTSYYTVEQVAAKMQLSKDHIYHQLSNGTLGCFRFGNKVRISDEQLQNWIECKRVYSKREVDASAATHTAIRRGRS